MLPYLLATPVPCSCLLCGNRRKYEGVTRQEIQYDFDEATTAEWLVLADSSLAFWDNEADAIYDEE